MEQLKEYISVSDYARYINKTPQTVYNMIESGIVSAFKFSRGKMSGWMVAKPAEYDEWQARKSANNNNVNK